MVSGVISQRRRWRRCALLLEVFQERSVMTNREGNLTQKGDPDFFAAAIRGLDEEFAISEDAVEDIKVSSLNVEYLTLSVTLSRLSS